MGLTSGACFAEMGNDVMCMDVDKKKIDNLKKGVLPIYEPDLEELVKKTNIHFTTDIKEAIDFADIIFCAVGTPQGRDQRADLETVKKVAQEFGKHINSYKILVNKSTVPVGTASTCKQIILHELTIRNKSIDFDVVSNPEFLREGSAIKDTFNPDRIVVGTDSPRAKKAFQKLYAKFENLLFTDIKTAEVIKYAANSMLATKISFINEMANFCEKCGANIKDVAKGIGLDKRIGTHFLSAGIGYGGSCLPKDVKALIQTGADFDHEFKILKSVDEVNSTQKSILIEKLHHLLGSLENKKIAIWGLAFKPNTDDMREAPSLTIIKKLQTEGAQIQAYDPVATRVAQALIEPFNISFEKSAHDAATDADALLILTEWDEFAQADLPALATLMKNPLILDGRLVLDKTAAEKASLTYHGIGIHQKTQLTKQSAPSRTPHSPNSC